MTEAEAKAYLTDKVAQRNGMNEISNKYYEEYSTFLTQRQILQMYDYEHKMMERMMMRHKKNKKP